MSVVGTDLLNMLTLSSGSSMIIWNQQVAGRWLWIRVVTANRCEVCLGHVAQQTSVYVHPSDHSCNIVAFEMTWNKHTVSKCDREGILVAGNCTVCCSVVF